MEGEKNNGRRRNAAVNISDIVRYNKTNVQCLAGEGSEGLEKWNILKGGNCVEKRLV